MPEGPEIKIISEQLNDMTRGSKCLSLEIISESKSFNTIDDSIIIPYYVNNFKTYKVNSPINFVTSKGKKIIFSFSDFYFISSPMLTGYWTHKENINSRICMRFEFFNLYYVDQTNFGTFEICLNISPSHNTLNKLGKDYLREHVCFEEFLYYCSLVKYSKWKICRFLYDQEIFSGIGSYLKNEILYESKISPHRKMNTLNNIEISVLYRSIYFILNKSYEMNGRKENSGEYPLGTKGNYEPSIHGKNKTTNNESVIKEKSSSYGSTYWCPSVQL